MRTTLIALGAALTFAPALAQTVPVGPPVYPAQGVPPKPLPARGGTSEASRGFAATIGGLNEFSILSSELAASKAEGAGVKALAAKLLVDHRQLKTERTMMMNTSNMPLPEPGLDEERAGAMAKLKGVTGAAFDAAYVEATLAAQQQAHDVMQAYAADGPDPKLKAYAEKSLPLIRGHLDLAKTLVRS